MNLVRLGHYHVPSGGGGHCQTALVVGVIPSADGADYVNLRVWDFDGDDERRLNVPAILPSEADAARATFHLSGDCPWHR